MGSRWILPLVALIVLASCHDDGVSSVAVAPTEDTDGVTTASAGTSAESSPDESKAEEAEGDEPEGDEPATPGGGDPDDTDIPVDEILAELEANGFCDPDDVEGSGDIGTATAMHFVVDAHPAPPCFGSPDDRLDQAWSDLVAVAPVHFLDGISLLAGYEACEGCDTLAFVSPLDEAGTFFLMAVDVTAAQDDPDELSLTLLHELSHVFTQSPATQLDIDVRQADCTTYHNGNGCVRESSYLWSWMARFWARDDLDALEGGRADEEAGDQRCALGGEYTGAYGASSPEEDFAEVFAAYVFDVDFGGDLDEKLAFFGEYDEFRQIRDRADELGLTGLPNTFDRCR